MDDTSRNAYRAFLALAPSEICRRCGESAISPDLKASIASRPFPLRYSEDDKVKISCESLWSELFPSSSAVVERHHRQLSAELVSIFSHSNSRTDGSLPKLEKVQFRDVGDLHQALLKFVKAPAVYDGNRCNVVLEKLSEQTMPRDVESLGPRRFLGKSGAVQQAQVLRYVGALAFGY